MKFVLRMAWREARASAARLAFFFLCVSMGVAAIVVLRSVMQTVRVTLTREARAIIGADVVIRSSAPFSPQARAAIDDVGRVSGVTARAEVIETQTMAAPLEGRGSGTVRLVELMAIGTGFPFYGSLELEDGRPFTLDRLAGQGALVTPTLLAELSLEVGDTIRLGGRSFTIRGAVTRDRVQRSGGFSFGPRVYVSVDDIRGTTLLGFGSRATHQLALQVPETGLNDLTRLLRERLGRQAVVRNWRSLEDRLGQNLAIGENYLSLVGFAIVVLGGIGVWSVARVVVEQKIKSVAILKCLGTSARQVLAIYLLQMAWLATGGSLLGLAAAAGIVASLPAAWLAPLGVEGVSVTWSAAAQGMVVGVLVSLLFALVPLLETRRVKPLLLLRADARAGLGRGWQTRLAWAGTSAVLVAVAIWQAGAVQAGLIVAAGLAAVALTLLFGARGLLRVVAPLTRSSRFAVRHGAISLGRPGNQTGVTLMAVGLGCFFILSVRAVQMNLLHEFDAQMSGPAPDFILIDIQRDQIDGVGQLVAPYVRQPPRLLPILRARITAVAGARLKLPTADAIREHRRLTREYGVTFRSALEPNERIIAGRFWSTSLAGARLDAAAETEVSIAKDLLDDADLAVGDVLSFDVAGQALTARITSLRDVAWDEAQNGGFVFVLRPGAAVDRTAHTYVGFLETGADPRTRGLLQRALVKGFPNVSAIDVAEVLASIREVIGNVTLAVTVVGAVTLVSGVLILVGAVSMTKFQRLYEAAIYRTLGASARRMAGMIAIEYALIGGLAGVMGAVGAGVLSWALARYVFDMPWVAMPGLLAAGATLTALVVTAVGLASSADVWWKKPLRTLRSE